MKDLSKIQLTVPQRTLLLKISAGESRIKIKETEARDTRGDGKSEGGELYRGFKSNLIAAIELLLKLPSGFDLVNQVATGKHDVEIWPTEKLSKDLDGMPIAGSINTCKALEAAVSAEEKKTPDEIEAARAIYTKMGACDPKKGCASKFYIHAKFGDNMMKLMTAQKIELVARKDGSQYVSITKQVASEETPFFICVGHELIHARRYQLGIGAKHDSDFRDYKAADKNNAKLALDDKALGGLKLNRFPNREERETVEGPSGVAGKAGDITENQLRKEAELPLRAKYSPEGDAAHFTEWDLTKGKYIVSSK